MMQGHDIGGRRRSKREPIEVLEPKRDDGVLKRVASIRQRRLDRLERAFVVQRQQLAQARQTFRESGRTLRHREDIAERYWQGLSEAFRSMIITSAEFVRGRKRLAELKEDANCARADVLQTIAAWKDAFKTLRALSAELKEARRGVEKLEQFELAQREEA